MPKFNLKTTRQAARLHEHTCLTKMKIHLIKLFKIILNKATVNKILIILLIEEEANLFQNY